MLAGLFHRYLAGQFARPRGLVGRFLLGRLLERTSRGMNEQVLRMLDIEPGDRLLEVGFGGGSLLAAMLGAGARHVTGVDLSEAMVAGGRRRFRRQIASGRVQLLAGSVERLPIEDAALDKACSLNTLYFWKDPAAGMRELARVLRPRGLMIIGFEAPETMRAWPGHVHGFRIYEPEEVVRLAEEAGFGNAVVQEGLEPEYGKIYCVKARRT